jgi:hypothetical protein
MSWYYADSAWTVLDGASARPASAKVERDEAGKYTRIVLSATPGRSEPLLVNNHHIESISISAGLTDITIDDGRIIYMKKADTPWYPIPPVEWAGGEISLPAEWMETEIALLGGAGTSAQLPDAFLVVTPDRLALMDSNAAPELAMTMITERGEQLYLGGALVVRKELLDWLTYVHVRVQLALDVYTQDAVLALLQGARVLALASLRNAIQGRLHLLLAAPPALTADWLTLATAYARLAAARPVAAELRTVMSEITALPADQVQGLLVFAMADTLGPVRAEQQQVILATVNRLKAAPSAALSPAQHETWTHFLVETANLPAAPLPAPVAVHQVDAPEAVANVDRLVATEGIAAVTQQTLGQANVYVNLGRPVALLDADQQHRLATLSGLLLLLLPAPAGPLLGQGDWAEDIPEIAHPPAASPRYMLDNGVTPNDPLLVGGVTSVDPQAYFHLYDEIMLGVEQAKAERLRLYPGEAPARTDKGLDGFFNWGAAWVGLGLDAPQLAGMAAADDMVHVNKVVHGDNHVSYQLVSTNAAAADKMLASLRRLAAKNDMDIDIMRQHIVVRVVHGRKAGESFSLTRPERAHKAVGRLARPRHFGRDLYLLGEAARQGDDGRRAAAAAHMAVLLKQAQNSAPAAEKDEKVCAENPALRLALDAALAKAAAAEAEEARQAALLAATRAQLAKVEAAKVAEAAELADKARLLAQSQAQLADATAAILRGQAQADADRARARREADAEADRARAKLHEAGLAGDALRAQLALSKREADAAWAEEAKANSLLDAEKLREPALVQQATQALVQQWMQSCPDAQPPTFVPRDQVSAEDLREAEERRLDAAELDIDAAARARELQYQQVVANTQDAAADLELAGLQRQLRRSDQRLQQQQLRRGVDSNKIQVAALQADTARQRKAAKTQQTWSQRPGGPVQDFRQRTLAPDQIADDRLLATVTAPPTPAPTAPQPPPAVEAVQAPPAQIDVQPPPLPPSRVPPPGPPPGLRTFDELQHPTWQPGVKGLIHNRAVKTVTGLGRMVRLYTDEMPIAYEPLPTEEVTMDKSMLDGKNPLVSMDLASLMKQQVDDEAAAKLAADEAAANLAATKLAAEKLAKAEAAAKAAAKLAADEATKLAKATKRTKAEAARKPDTPESMREARARAVANLKIGWGGGNHRTVTNPEQQRAGGMEEAE